MRIGSIVINLPKPEPLCAPLKSSRSLSFPQYARLLALKKLQLNRVRELEMQALGYERSMQIAQHIYIPNPIPFTVAPTSDKPQAPTAVAPGPFKPQ